MGGLHLWIVFEHIICEKGLEVNYTSDFQESNKGPSLVAPYQKNYVEFNVYRQYVGH